MRIIDTNYFFSGDFQGQEGVRIMHQCALYNPKYGSVKILNVLVFFGRNVISRSGKE
jgi:hypothetical protein